MNFTFPLVGVIVLATIIIFTVSTKRGLNQSAPSPVPSQMVSIDNAAVVLDSNGFQPNTINIRVNTKVIWTNQSGQDATVSSDNHPTHLLYPPLNLGKFSGGQTLSLVFPKAGSFGYHNHLNPSQTGKVVVSE